jgi:hypothetical protein
VQPCDEDEQFFFYQVLQVMEHQWNEFDRGKPTTRRKTCPSATLSTTNLTWTDLGSNPGLRGERPATNRLSHGTVIVTWLVYIKINSDNPFFLCKRRQCLLRLRNRIFKYYLYAFQASNVLDA